jgi:hypothetical protein
MTHVLQSYLLSRIGLIDKSLSVRGGGQTSRKTKPAGRNSCYQNPEWHGLLPSKQAPERCAQKEHKDPQGTPKSE